MNLGKADFAAKGQAVQKFLLCLTGETDNDISGQRTVRKSCLQTPGGCQILCSRVPAVHALQHPVIA